eukprot:scaffold74239_cov15-Tisochrysis_lutea.AAC.2
MRVERSLLQIKSTPGSGKFVSVLDRKGMKLQTRHSFWNSSKPTDTKESLEEASSQFAWGHLLQAALHADTPSVTKLSRIGCIIKHQGLTMLTDVYP